MKKFLVLLLLIPFLSLSFAQEDMHEDVSEEDMHEEHMHEDEDVYEDEGHMGEEHENEEEQPDALEFNLIHKLSEGTTVEELHSISLQQLDVSPVILWETLTGSILRVQEESGNASSVTTQIEWVVPEGALPPDFELPTFMIETNFALGTMNFDISSLQIDKFSWGGAKGALSFKDIKHPHSINVHLPEISFSSYGESGSLKNVVIRIENINDKLRGVFSLDIENLSFSDHGQNASIDNLSISLKSQENDESMSYAWNLSLGKTVLSIPGNEISFDEFALQFGFLGLDKGVLAQLENNLEDIKSISPQASEDFLEKSMGLLDELLQKSPQITVNQKLSNEQGQQQLSLSVSADHEKMDGFDPQSLQQAVQLEGKFSINQSLLVYLIERVVYQELMNYGEFSSDEELAAQMKEETNQRISDLLAQNIFVEDGANFVSEFTFADGVFTLNGNEMK